MVYEVVIIGSGPAGLTAGIYLGRFKRNPLIIDGLQPGGQLMTTGAVENWPGNVSINGPELMKNMRIHAGKSGCFFLSDIVVEVDFSSQPFVIKTKNNKPIQASSIIIATGASPIKLECLGEEEYWGKGVNVCATCDAPLYKGKEVVVVGGGNSAIAESYALSKYADKVTILQLGKTLTATDPLKDVVIEQNNIDVLCNVKVVEIKGDGQGVKAVVLENQQDKTTFEYKTQGVFIAIGHKPNSSIFSKQLLINDRGYLQRSNGQQTSIGGVFAVGDVADYRYRQAITAAGQGCSAAIECETFLKTI